MFKFLKNKLKKVVSNFSKEAEEDIKAKVDESQQQPSPAQSSDKDTAGEIHPPSEPVAKLKPVAISQSEKSNERPEEDAFKKPKKTKSILQKLTDVVRTTTLSEEKLKKLFDNMELALLENNVALEVIEKIKDDLRVQLIGRQVLRGKVETTLNLSLKDSIEGLFNVSETDLIKKIKEKKPYIILFAGINGSGKTTSIAKITNMIVKNKLKCVLAASDTFRAAAIHQLGEHADKLGVKMIKHDYGSDPAAVAFDAIEYAKAKNLDAVLIDTAGRLQSNTNLIDELRKIVKVARPDFKIFVGEAIAGNDCVNQARTFNDAIGIDGIILAKADIDEKGGAAISVSYITKKPIIYLGTGQEYSDLKPFNPFLIVESLGLSEVK